MEKSIAELEAEPQTEYCSSDVVRGVGKCCSLIACYLVDLGSLSRESIPKDDGAFIVTAG